MRSALLKDLCDFRHGGTPSKAVPAYWSGEIPWVSPKDMKTTTVCEASDRISEAAVANSATSVAPVGSTLLVVRSGILAHTLPVALVTAPVAFNQDIKAVVPKSADVSAAYIYWFLRSKAAEVVARGVKKGATVHSVQSGFIEGLQVLVPTSGEQRLIVDLLSRAEGIVRLRRQAQQKAAALIPAIFAHMFGDPATNPKGWSSRQLADLLAHTKLGLVRGAKEMGPGLAYPYLRMDAVGSGQVQLCSLRRVDASPSEIREYSLREGDFLFNTRNSRELVGKTGMVAAVPAESTLFNNNLMRMRFHEDDVLPQFINWQFQTAHVQRQLDSMKRGTTSVFAVYYKDLKKLQLVVPPIDRQRQFSERAEQLLAIRKRQEEATEMAEAAFSALLARSFGCAQAPAAVPSEEGTVT